jgi:hypothetical protein
MSSVFHPWGTNAPKITGFCVMAATYALRLRSARR